MTVCYHLYVESKVEQANYYNEKEADLQAQRTN